MGWPAAVVLCIAAVAVTVAYCVRKAAKSEELSRQHNRAMKDVPRLSDNS